MSRGQVLRAATHLDSLAQRFHPDPGRLSACLLLDLLQALRDRLQRGDAALVAFVRLAETLAQAADLSLALDHHPRKRSLFGIRGRRMVLDGLYRRVARRHRSIDFLAAIAEKRPLEATHARHRRGALGRHPAPVAAQAVAPTARGPRAGSAPFPQP